MIVKRLSKYQTISGVKAMSSSAHSVIKKERICSPLVKEILPLYTGYSGSVELSNLFKAIFWLREAIIGHNGARENISQIFSNIN